MSRLRYPPVLDGGTTYRLRCLPTFTQPSVIRVAERDGEWQVIGKLTDGQGGYAAGRVVFQAQRSLSAKETKGLVKRLQRLDFWNMAPKEDRQGCDGVRLILEGVQAGRYHVIDRWSPGLSGYRPLKQPEVFGSFADLKEC